MADRNGFFQLVSSQAGTAVLITPPEGNGKPVTMNEVGDYLEQKRVEYSPTRVRAAIDGGQKVSVPLSGKPLTFKVNEETRVRVSEDRMSVIARFYPPVEGGDLVTEKELQGDLAALNVKAPLDEEVFRQFRADPAYCTDYVIARGEEPVQGKDGSVEYLFNTDLSVKPTVKEDGSVDFFHLNTVCSCGKDQELAKLHKEIPGQPGRDVYGEKLAAREVQKAKFKHGRNMHVSEDGLTLICDIDGHVQLVGDEVFVSDVLEIEDVDTSTGNIEDYEGSLLVKGSIRAGFTVKASGDVEVQGVVEGATVVAGGQISVARGINGMGKGILRAGTNVIAKYIENAAVEAGNYVHAECIMNSAVTAKETITVEGKKGFISGGSVRAGKKIEAKIIGSDMGTDTEVEVGVDPEKRARYAALKQENVELQNNVKRIQPVLLGFKQKMQKGEKFSPAQVAQVKTLSDTMLNSQKQFAANTEEIKQLEEEFQESSDACVAVHDQLFAGTKLTVAGVSITVKKPYKYCRFMRKGADIKSLPLL